jgi:light-harvesting complex I chlorophyll a/b binding protein 1
MALDAMSKSIPFLTVPEKLDGSMPGDMGFDPMGLSEIQADLIYARWAELKHGRMCQLAIVGMLWQEYGPHLPGAAYAETNPFAAPGSVPFVVNMQIFLGIGAVEILNFNSHYDGSQPGNLGWGSKGLDKMTEDQKAKRYEQEIVHCRLAMIAFTGAFTQSLLFGKNLLDFSA